MNWLGRKSKNNSVRDDRNFELRCLRRSGEKSAESPAADRVFVGPSGPAFRWQRQWSSWRRWHRARQRKKYMRRSHSRRIQILTVLTRRYNAHPPSHPVERVPAQDELAYRSHKSSTNRCTKGRRRVRLSAICGGWHTWNPSDPVDPPKA